MKVVRGLSEEALSYAQAALQLPFDSTVTGVMSLTDSGEVAGLALFTPVTKGNTNLHIAAKRKHWFTAEFCRAMFHHGFVTLQASRITASISAVNVPCLRLAVKTGFRPEGLLRGFDFGDLVLFGMLKGECKWVE